MNDVNPIIVCDGKMALETLGVYGVDGRAYCGVFSSRNDVNNKPLKRAKPFQSVKPLKAPSKPFRP